MNTPKKNKFNTNTKTKGFFPFPKYLFKTENHPIRLSAEKCSSAIEALFSPQEIQMLEGLTNSLQCDERETVRIALYEAARKASEVYEGYFECARWDTGIRGHTARSRKGKWSLPKIEKEEASLAAKQLKISDKEFLRIAIIWLARGIKNESIIRLSKSPRIPKDEVAMQWSRDNRGKPLSEAVKILKDARDNVKALSDYIYEKKQDEGFREYESNRSKPSDLKQIEEEELIEEIAANESWEQSFLEDNPDASDMEFLIRCKMREYQCDYEDAKIFVEGEIEEMEQLAKLTSKERLDFLKRRDLHESPRERAEKERKLALQKKRKADDDAWRAELDAREKTWVGYVNARRLDMQMINRPDPYPHLPNPLPENYPMPNDWSQEHLG